MIENIIIIIGFQHIHTQVFEKKIVCAFLSGAFKQASVIFRLQKSISFVSWHECLYERKKKIYLQNLKII